MRLRDLTNGELDAVALLRAELRATHGDAACDAPFLQDWEVVTIAGRRSLRGLCWGHPTLGDTIVTTSALVELGDGWGRTQSRLYVLGRERRPRALEHDLPPPDPEPSPCVP